MTDPTATAVTLVRDATTADLPALLALNLESEHFLSPLSAAGLDALYAAASWRRVVCTGGVVEGFLLAFREASDYGELNYRWFAARYPRFLYIDRIAIAATARGRQYGVRLYEDAFAQARRLGLAHVTCEYDIDPPNEPSRRFHERMGFREVGTQVLPARHKAVSMQERAL